MASTGSATNIKNKSKLTADKQNLLQTYPCSLNNTQSNAVNGVAFGVKWAYLGE